MVEAVKLQTMKTEELKQMVRKWYEVMDLVEDSADLISDGGNKLKKAKIDESFSTM